MDPKEHSQIMKNPQINPLLVSVLTSKTLDEVPTTPQLADLPGNFVQLVAKNNKMIDYPFESNIVPLVCENCRKKAKYDLGLLTINTNNYLDNKELSFQSTGYFRCKNCNSAGKWETTLDLKRLFFTTLLTINTSENQKRFSFGENRLYDGSAHKYASDAEEYFLKKVMGSPEDSFLWNRLGNSYYKGGRADLATCAFEHSVHINPLQTESYYSLGAILMNIGESSAAANQFYKMLVSSSQYTKMPAEDLRDLLSNGLRELLNLNISSSGNSNISLVPPKTIYEELKINFDESIQETYISLELELTSDELDSFYPLAEIFMGQRSNEMSDNKIYKYFKQKKKKRNKK